MATIFLHEILVGPDDIDMLGHASNVTYVRWIQDAALAHSAAVGLDVDAYKGLGAVFVIVRHEVDYVRPAMLGDAIEVRTWVTSALAAKCLRSTELVRKADGQILAKGVTTWAFIDIVTGRPRRISPAVRTAFSWSETANAPASTPLP